MPQSTTPRRTRLRLARQRPGPTHVRAREREEASEAGTRLAGLNLLTLGAIVTIVASIGGLAATGYGTIWSARVSADQLAQSREQGDDRKRAQAARVSYWVDQAPNTERRLHLMNRSPDPVANVWIFFHSWTPSSIAVQFIVRRDSLPPCSETLIEGSALEYLPAPERWSGKPGRKDPEWVQFEEAPAITPTALYFTDRDGREWRRRFGTLTLGESSEREHVFRGLDGRITKVPLVKPVIACGDDASK